MDWGYGWHGLSISLPSRGCLLMIINIRAGVFDPAGCLPAARRRAGAFLFFMAWLFLASALLVMYPEANAQGSIAGDAYHLGPGDKIVITVFGEPDLSMDFQLNDTGTLSYPFLGELGVAGLNVTELEKLITDGLKGPYLVDPDVAVSIREYRPFFISGEVKRPGGIPYQPGLTLQGAIALGGGFTERAAKDKVMVIRANDVEQTSQSIDLDGLVGPGDLITIEQSFF